MQTVAEKTKASQNGSRVLPDSFLEGKDTIPVTKTDRSSINEVDWSQLTFGRYVSDHMFICKYEGGAWQDPKIVPFQNLSLPPTALALHYAQSVFEGMKAFRTTKGEINIFRLDKHHERLNKSLHRMCMPHIPYDMFANALSQLVKLDEAWVPEGEDKALYIRPLVFASEGHFGVKVADEYTFVVITAPVAVLYQKPVKVKVERQYIRAAQGGTGFAKCAGNYGGVFYPTQKAKEEGFDNILWMDAAEHEYMEESGTMNLFFVIDGKLVTPPLSDTILNGVTRDSLLQLAVDLNIPAEERPVAAQEIIKGIKSGKLTEAFGAGTAAVVAPIGAIGVDGELYHLPLYNESNIMFQLKKGLEDIRTGKATDAFGWNYLV